VAGQACERRPCVLDLGNVMVGGNDVLAEGTLGRLSHPVETVVEKT